MRTPYFAYAMVWLSTAAATVTAIIATDSAVPLWAMLIPTFISIKGEYSKDDAAKESN